MIQKSIVALLVTSVLWMGIYGEDWLMEEVAEAVETVETVERIEDDIHTLHVISIGVKDMEYQLVNGIEGVSTAANTNPSSDNDLNNRTTRYYITIDTFFDHFGNRIGTDDPMKQETFHQVLPADSLLMNCTDKWHVLCTKQNLE
ncbi:hypothetical protein [Neobacillus sp. 19]|uniref:hypothetical protein n=1 Tax=Neobacillus sp. 19 TaxID=3394458 RepID=UPI003BF69FF7